MRCFGLLVLTILLSTLTVGQDHFPLSVGNLWQYEEEYPYTEWRVTYRAEAPVMQSNGLAYYMSAGAEPLREDGDKVYAFRSEDSSEYLLYDFSAVVGDTISFTNFGWITLQSIDTISLYGMDRVRWQFGFDYGWGMLTRTVVDGIGLVAFTGEVALNFLLQGAIVDGVQYGTIVSVPENDDVPTTPSLIQNYPNPFNPSTTIAFNLQEPTRISISIHNVSGEKIATLVDGQQMQPGSHEVSWRPEGIATGVYFCRLNLDGSVLIQRLVYIR